MKPLSIESRVRRGRTAMKSFLSVFAKSLSLIGNTLLRDLPHFSIGSVTLPCSLVVLLLLIPSTARTALGSHFETAGRDLPVAFDVDVLVLGGTSAGVAAALESQKAGAKTLLLTPYTYLGEDLTATLRMEAAPEESLADPLAAAIYIDPQTDEDALASPYLFLDSQHRLTPKLEMPGPISGSTDIFYDRNSDHTRSRVQSNGDATIILDFEAPRQVGYVSLLSGRHRKNVDYIVDTVSFYCSDDKRQWKALATNVPVSAPPRGVSWGNAHTFETAEPVHTRYVRIDAKQHPEAIRMLLSEVVVFPDRNYCTIKKMPRVGPIPAAIPVERRDTLKRLPRPMHVKKVLDDELLRAGIPFLYATLPTSVLKSPEGRIVGAIVANRAGRQAVLAKKVLFAPVDHPRGTRPAGRLEFGVIGGEPVPVDPSKFDWMKSVRVEMIGEPYRGPWPNRAETASGVFPLWRYVFETTDDVRSKIALRDSRLSNRIESDIRSAVHHPDIQFTSDRVFIETEGKAAADFICEKRPIDGIASGRKAGRNAAREAAALKRVDPETIVAAPLPYGPEDPAKSGVRLPEGTALGEMLDGLKANARNLRRLTIGTERFPILGEYDVLVVGGGTSGAPAAISAGRAGVRTAVVEYLHEFGGTGTAGAISVYWHGHREGFTAEVLGGKKEWNIRHKMHWWSEEMRKVGVDMFFGALACGTVFESGPSMRTVRGVLVVTPDGPGIITARITIDATGNADVAAAAGTKTRYSGDDQLAIQGAGLPPIDLGASYTNTDYYFIDENDMFDVMHVYIYGKRKFHDSFDIAKMIDSRERRRIVGDHVLTVLDHINKRTFTDTIMLAASNYDSHGTLTDAAIYFPGTYSKVNYSNVPYRSSLPKELDGILVAGLGTSADRDAVPLIRMQPDLQNQGYALGRAAAMSVRDGVSTRNVDMKKLQEHLVEIGNLPSTVLTDVDSFETSRNMIDEAIKSLDRHYEGISILLWHPEESREPLLNAMKKAADNKKIYYASALAAIGDPSGASVLRDEVRRYVNWDDGPGWVRPVRGHGFRFTELARSILLLGKIRDKEAVPLIAEKLTMKRGEGKPTSFRACIQALAWIGDSAAVGALEEFLSLPGRRGNWITMEDVYRTSDPDALLRSSEDRVKAMHELMAAEALCRCGDPHRIGIDILRHYADDVRGFYSRYATWVLKSIEPTRSDRLPSWGRHSARSTFRF